MNLPLNQSAVLQLEAWLVSVDDNYALEDAALLKSVVQNAIQNRTISEDDAYLLLDLLPRIIPKPSEEEIKVEDDYIWEEKPKENQMFKKHTEMLHQMILNLLFQQNAIRQSRNGQEQAIEKAVFYSIRKRDRSKNR